MPKQVFYVCDSCKTPIPEQDRLPFEQKPYINWDDGRLVCCRKCAEEYTVWEFMTFVVNKRKAAKLTATGTA